MASSAKHFLLLFFLTLLSSQKIHARESQFFNKIPSNSISSNDLKDVEAVPNNEEPLNKPGQEPSFIPENENGRYGLYDNEFAQLPPATTTTNTNGEPYKTTSNLPYNSEAKGSLPKYLPKNYNPEAYVTEPEGYRPAQENQNNYNYYSNNEQEGYSTVGNGNNYYNNDGNSFNGQQQGMSDTRFAQNGYTTTGRGGYNRPIHDSFNGQQEGMSDTRLAQSSYTTTGRGGYNGPIHDSFNGQQEGMSNTRLAQSSYTTTGRGGYNGPIHDSFNGENTNNFQKQGMSDTRFLDNGKFYYDVSSERNNFNANNYGGYNGNYENSYKYQNSQTGYQNQDQFQGFQDEDDMP